MTFMLVMILTIMMLLMLILTDGTAVGMDDDAADGGSRRCQSGSTC